MLVYSLHGSGECVIAKCIVYRIADKSGILPYHLENGAGKPATIPLEQVIEGWAKGVCLMNVGGHYKFYIPPDLAYGPTGAGDLIPPNSVLVFDVELIDIEE
jgi:hypothetical protein